MQHKNPKLLLYVILNYISPYEWSKKRELSNITVSYLLNSFEYRLSSHLQYVAYIKYNVPIRIFMQYHSFFLIGVVAPLDTLAS